MKPENELLIRILLDRAKSSDLEELDRWLTQDSSAREEWAQIQEVWRESEPVEAAKFDAQQGWRDLSARLNLGVPRPSWRRRLTWITAMAVCMFAIAFYVDVDGPSNGWDVQAKTGQERQFLHLADGSRVILEPGSELRFRMGDLREVELQGRAVFDVSHDDSTFVVTTAEARVEVLGTNFDVWSRSQRTEVALAEGRVRITDQRNQQKILEPNQHIVCDEVGFVGDSQDSDHDLLLGWPQGELVFVRQPLSRITDELSAQFQVPIRFEAGIDVSRSVTARFQNEDLAGILGQLGLTLDLEHRVDGRGYLLVKKGAAR